MNKPILLTRPSDRSNSMQVKLSALGYQILDVPCLQIEHTSQKISNISDYQIIIFVSVNAVEGFFKNTPPLFNKNSTIMAIGEKTAAALAEFGVSDVIYPISEFDQNSESFIKLPALNNIYHSKVLLVRGDHSREYISSALLDKQALLEELIVYQTTSPVDLQLSLNNKLEQLSASELSHLTILITSNSILENLSLNSPTKYSAYLSDAKLIVVSDRIAVRARELGYKNIFVTHTMNEDSIIAMITS